MGSSDLHDADNKTDNSDRAHLLLGWRSTDSLSVDAPGICKTGMQASSLPLQRSSLDCNCQKTCMCTLYGVPCAGMISQDGQGANIMVHASAAVSNSGRCTQGREQHSKAPDLSYSASLQTSVYFGMTGCVLACH